MLYINRLGEQVVRNHRGGGRLHNLCYRDSYRRVRFASRQVSHRPLSAWNGNSQFCRLWGSLIRNDGVWLTFPEAYRGLGAPGALASIGMGMPVDQQGIWSGWLSPGAVLQTWDTRADYEGVRRGEKTGVFGHSFVFLRYVWSGFAIVGMKVADNGYHGRAIVKQSAWGFWTATNLTFLSDVPRIFSPRGEQPAHA